MNRLTIILSLASMATFSARAGEPVPGPTVVESRAGRLGAADGLPVRHGI